MTWRLRPLGPGEVDHELLWGSVGVAVAIVGAVMLAAIGVPAIGCPFKAATGLPCLTCGTTRMIVAVLHGHVADAVRCNPLVAAAGASAVPFGVYAWAAVVFGTRRIRLTVSPAGAVAVRALTWGVLAANWVFLVVDGR